MREPRWFYGLPINVGRLYDLAKEIAPECFYEDEKTTTVVELVEKYGYMLDQALGLEVGIDVLDDNLEEPLVLVLHNESFRFNKLRLEDEDFLRKELGIKEKGRWYRYNGAFNFDMLDYYKERVKELGTIPSRTSDDSSGASEGSKACTKCEGKVDCQHKK